MFEEIEYTADVALRVRAPDLPGLFIASARGMFHLMGADPTAPPQTSRRVELHGGDTESLLVDWLNELLYLREAHGEQYVAFEIEELSPTRLVAIAHGSPVPSLPGRRIKAATFHDLRVERTGEGYGATVVFDV